LSPALPISNASVSSAPGTAPDLPGRTLVLGLGNDILTDDAIGLLVVRQLQSELSNQPALDIRETSEMGLALLDFFAGYSRVILVDSIQTGRVPPGSIHEVDAGALKHLTGRTPHFLGVGETLALGRALGLLMPEEVTIFAIEVEDPFTLGTRLTPAVQAALPGVVERIGAALLA
jgi:hydrogenase maturation protease